MSDKDRLRLANRQLKALTKVPQPGRRDRESRLIDEALERYGQTKEVRVRSFQRRGWRHI